MSERAMFEDWARDNQYDMRVYTYRTNVFVDARTEAAWQAWHARSEATADAC